MTKEYEMELKMKLYEIEKLINKTKELLDEYVDLKEINYHHAKIILKELQYEKRKMLLFLNILKYM